MCPTDLQQSPTPWPVFGLQCLQQLLAYVAVASQARKIPRWNLAIFASAAGWTNLGQHGIQLKS